MNKKNLSGIVEESADGKKYIRRRQINHKIDYVVGSYSIETESETFEKVGSLEACSDYLLNYDNLK